MVVPIAYRENTMKHTAYVPDIGNKHAKSEVREWLEAGYAMLPPHAFTRVLPAFMGSRDATRIKEPKLTLLKSQYAGQSLLEIRAQFGQHGRVGTYHYGKKYRKGKVVKKRNKSGNATAKVVKVPDQVKNPCPPLRRIGQWRIEVYVNRAGKFIVSKYSDELDLYSAHDTLDDAITAYNRHIHDTHADVNVA